MIRVAVVDDQSLIRVGLRTILAAEDDIELVGEASDGREALQLVREQHPDVVLMDIRMPHYDGLAALRDICSDPDLDSVRVIMLTTFELDQYVFEALRRGASGFLLKDADPEELLRAIRVVADGGALLAASVTRRVVEEFAGRSTAATNFVKSAHPDIDRLTDREREIVAWVATGLSNDEIAAELVVSPATVRTHVGRAMMKLQARDRAQLVVFAVQSGLTVDQH